MPKRPNDGPHPQGSPPQPPADPGPDRAQRRPDEDGVQGDEGSGGYNPDPSALEKRKRG